MVASTVKNGNDRGEVAMQIKYRGDQFEIEKLTSLPSEIQILSVFFLKSLEDERFLYPKY